MSDIHITINGGTNTIVPNATKVEQHFHGNMPEEKFISEENQETELPTETAHFNGSERTAEADSLGLYINKVNIPPFLEKVRNSHSAAELADAVFMLLEQEPRLDSEQIVKERFIKLLLPLAPLFERGKTVSNVQQHINNTLARRPKIRH